LAAQEAPTFPNRNCYRQNTLLTHKVNSLLVARALRKLRRTRLQHSGQKFVWNKWLKLPQRDQSVGTSKQKERRKRFEKGTRAFQEE
jgi:predicted kinase